MIGPRLAWRITLLLGGLFSPVAVEAQEAARVARIGYLVLGPAAPSEMRAALDQGLRDLGLHRGPQRRDRIPICRGEVRAASRSRGRTGCAQVEMRAGA